MCQIVVENLVKTFCISKRAVGLWGAVRGVVRRRHRTVRALALALDGGELIGHIQQRAIALSGDSPDETAELARSYALAGRKTEAMALLEKLRAMLDGRYVAPSTFVSLYAALDDDVRAFAWLERAHAERDFLLVMARVEPMFDELRPDPRFAVLLQRLALPPQGE